MSFDDIDIEVTRKNIKNLYLRVSSPDGLVRISAPRRMRLDNIHRFVASRRDWIKKQQDKVRLQARETTRAYVNDEIHYFSGQPYSLKLIEHRARPRVEVSEQTLSLYIRPDTATEKRCAILDAWYRQYLTKIISVIISRYESDMGVKVSVFGVRKMKTRWGSCNTRVRRIWLNLELAKRSAQCLEYVVVHEMVHLLEPSHNKRFYALMDRFMPDWKVYKAELKMPNKFEAGIALI
ncbi:MAG: M48 family metallopeptidase [Gammaproteobacteria bacterium]|nr:M48 family metallopeptidase [Gammaproteobacteria bacterium]